MNFRVFSTFSWPNYPGGPIRKGVHCRTTRFFRECVLVGFGYRPLLPGAVPMSLVRLLKWFEEKEYLDDDVKGQVQVATRFSSKDGTAYAQFILGENKAVVRCVVGKAASASYSVEGPSGFVGVRDIDQLLELVGASLHVNILRHEVA